MELCENIKIIKLFQDHTEHEIQCSIWLTDFGTSLHQTNSCTIYIVISCEYLMGKWTDKFDVKNNLIIIIMRLAYSYQKHFENQ